MSSAAETVGTSTAPWYTKYPAPVSETASISREELLAMLKEGMSVVGKDLVLVDLRRNDHEGGTIRGSINLPAQSLWPAIPKLYQLFKAAGVGQVVWYCGSSRGRGSRAASWFADYVTGCGDEGMKSLALLGGIKGWVEAGSEYVQFVDEYDSAVWG